MTKLGEFLHDKSINKAIVARKTGLSKQRMGDLTLNDDAKLRAVELWLIAKAIKVEPNELLIHVCNGLELLSPKELERRQNLRKEEAKFRKKTELKKQRKVSSDQNSR